MSATQVVIDSLNAQISATRADIDAALIAGNATVTLRKRLSTCKAISRPHKPVTSPRTLMRTRRR